MSFLFWLQKNIFWVVVGSAVFLGFSLAYMSSTMAALLLPEPVAAPGARPRAKVSAVPRSRPFEDYESIIVGNLFQGRQASNEEGVAVEVKDIVLHGVLAGARSFARAIIQIKGENDIREYAISEEAGGNRVMAIYGNSVLLDRGGRQMELVVGADTSTQPAPAPAPTGDQSTPDAKRITIPRSRIIALTKDPAAATKTKMTPVTIAGKIAGLKLVLVPNDSIFFELGARTGDIIRRLNGQPLENQDRLMEFYMQLKTMDRINVEVERGGKILPFEIVIQN
jgi:general secretion pathway protein C